jgi:hypothetical protein
MTDDTPNVAPPRSGLVWAEEPLSRWRRIGEWLRPPSAPRPRRFNETTDALLTRLCQPSNAVITELLEEANAAFAGATDRSESAERRAATIQSAISIAASLTLAGGSLLLGANNVANEDWRIGIAIGFAVAVLMFAMAAWRAFLVTWPRFMWATPGATDIPDHATGNTADEIRLKRVADLLVAYGRNDSIAQIKIRLLGQAVRWMLSALAVIAALAISLAIYSIERPSNHDTGATTTTRAAIATNSQAMPSRALAGAKNAVSNKPQRSRSLLRD